MELRQYVHFRCSIHRHFSRAFPTFFPARFSQRQSSMGSKRVRIRSSASSPAKSIIDMNAEDIYLPPSKQNGSININILEFRTQNETKICEWSQEKGLYVMRRDFDIEANVTFDRISEGDFIELCLTHTVGAHFDQPIYACPKHVKHDQKYPSPAFNVRLVNRVDDGNEVMWTMCQRGVQHFTCRFRTHTHQQFIFKPLCNNTCSLPTCSNRTDAKDIILHAKIMDEHGIEKYQQKIPIQVMNQLKKSKSQSGEKSKAGKRRRKNGTENAEQSSISEDEDNPTRNGERKFNSLTELCELTLKEAKKYYERMIAEGKSDRVLFEFEKFQALNK